MYLKALFLVPVKAVYTQCILHDLEFLSLRIYLHGCKLCVHKYEMQDLISAVVCGNKQKMYFIIWIHKLNELLLQI
jgi:hypothetical protein